MNNKLKSLLRKNNFLFENLKKFYHFCDFIFLKNFAGSNKDIFSNIYLKNKWKDNYSFSGTGSNLDQTINILNQLPNFFIKYKIKSILDIPCGDFYWMKNLKFESINYIGADIVPELIQQNINKFENTNIKFKVLDITTNKLPESDIIFCRDCFVHLSFQDIFKSLNNIRNSKFKYLITTNFIERESNMDIATGSWRTINLLKPPFNFPEPIENISEKCTEANGKYFDKVLSIWDINSIPLFENF